MNRSIIGISDVSLGYGSTQIPLFIKYLKAKKEGYRAIVFEVDQPEKAYIRDRYPEFTIERVMTGVPCYTKAGRIEYIRKCTKIINKLKPEILVLFCSFTLPVLFGIKYRPEKVIYYNIEMASAYGKSDMVLNSMLSGKADLLIYPESNRAMLDIRKFGPQNIPAVEIYNCCDREAANGGNTSGEDCAEKNGKIIYSGTLDYENTNAGYLLDRELNQYKIDIFGNVTGKDSEKLRQELISLNANVRYHGYIANEELRRIKKQYAYSIVMWNPVNENQYFAAPNKFFESIADSVIPIAAPHPQCRELINKYDCGILMRDWSLEAFKEALQVAKTVYGTRRYEEMTENCRRAVEEELSWEKQMEKLDQWI